VKGSFVGEIVTALQDGRIDLAVHSAKDLPAIDPDGIVVSAVPERADACDVLVTRGGFALEVADQLVGTSSIRRRAQLLRLYPRTRLVELRGNVDTRLRKLEAGDVDAVVLAAAGLARLGIRPAHVTPFDPLEMVPAPGQGALAVQTRDESTTIVEMVRRLDHRPSRAAFEAERRVMSMLGGGCALPLGAFARVIEDVLTLRAVVIRADGTGLVEAHAEGPAPAAVAETVVGSLLAAGAAEILDEVRRG
jgi:hydroxymethylbilane synthase